MKFPSKAELFWDMATAACPPVRNNQAQWESFTDSLAAKGIKRTDIVDALRILWDRKKGTLRHLPFESQANYVEGVLRRSAMEARAELQAEVEGHNFATTIFSQHDTIPIQS